jgi:hypothetical protein
MMKALSIHQPWAWLICMGYKNVENRSWRLVNPRRIYVHAGKSRVHMDDTTISWVVERLGEQQRKTFAVALPNLQFGAIIGEADITECVTGNKSPWFTPGLYGLVLANPVLYDTPKVCQGSRRLFTPSFGDDQATLTATGKHDKEG